MIRVLICDDSTEVRSALRAVLDDDVPVETLEMRNGRSPAPLQRELTARECEVLQLVADGRSTCQIGQSLYISEETVKTHVRNFLRKLRAESRANAVAIAIRRGLIE